jgi:penicillin-insensitive murein endopeptidase
VRDFVVKAYRELEKEAPGKRFVFGETGWKTGGRIRPHRTHQNGVSVDFMVPVLDSDGKSVPLPTGPLNRFGYGIDFDGAGRSGDLRIDFPYLKQHVKFMQGKAWIRHAEHYHVDFSIKCMPR